MPLLDPVRENAEQNLQGIVGSARLVVPLAAPSADGWPDLFRAVELRNAKAAKIVGNAIQPW